LHAQLTDFATPTSRGSSSGWFSWEEGMGRWWVDEPRNMWIEASKMVISQADVGILAHKNTTKLGF